MASLSDFTSTFRADSFDSFPIPKALLSAVHLLIELDYTPEAIDAIATHVALFGTVEGCFWVDAEHRARVEATLLRDPVWRDPAWDRHFWATND